MTHFAEAKAKDPALLAARILLMLLFVISGWGKLNTIGTTEGFFTGIGVPFPELAVVIAIVMELFVGMAIGVGVLTRPLTIIMAVYTLGTALLGHQFWNATGIAQIENEHNFFKNVSIIGGLIALYVSGAGRYSVDHKIRLSRPAHTNSVDWKR